MADDPDQIWNELSDGKDRSGWMVRRLDPAATTGLMLGVHHPECLPSILIEVRPRPGARANEWPSTRGIEIAPDRWGDTIGVRLTLSEPALRSVFCALVDDLVPLAAGEDSAKRVHARLEAWLALLSRRKQSGLDKDQQVALMSELEVLRRLSVQVTVPILIQGWEGPLDDRGTNRGLHDFRLPGVRIEVKGTARVPAQTVTISRHAQLDPDAIGQDTILLAVACWSTGTKGSISLPSMISAIRAITASHSITKIDLEDRLRAAGWLDSDAHLYEGQGWTLLELRWYEILDGFPRIRCRDLPAGIIDGEYTISLHACDPWRRDQQTAFNKVNSIPDEQPE